MAIYIDRLQKITMAAFVNKITCEWRSEPGIGKSSVAKQTAREMAMKLGQAFGFAVRHLSTMDPTEVAGPLFITKRTLVTEIGEKTMEMAVNSYPALFPNDSDIVFLPDGTETTIGKFGKVPRFGIVFLDELRQAPHDTQKPAARFMDEQRIGDWSLSMFGGMWGILAASNRTEDNSGVNKDLAYITNRKLVINVRSSADILINHFETLGDLHFMCIGFIRAFPGSVFTSVVPKDDKPFPTPRSYERASRMLMQLGTEGAPAHDAEATEVAAGLIGEGRAAELCGYFRIHGDLVSMADIEKDPKKCRLPDRADIMWANIQMMIHNATEKNVIKLLSYGERFPRDFQLPLIASLNVKLPELAYHQEYMLWCANNKSLLMAAYAADRRLRGNQ